MRTLFLLLALISIGMMSYTFWIGWRLNTGRAEIEKREAAGEIVSEEERSAIGELIGPHFVWGMTTGIMISLVHSIVLVYFLGTGKAIKHQMELQNWDETDYRRNRKLMARALTPSVMGIVIVCVVAFSGGFTLIQTLPPSIHLAIAAAGLLAQFPIYVWQLGLINENSKIMDDVLKKLDGGGIRIAL